MQYSFSRAAHRLWWPMLLSLLLLVIYAHAEQDNITYAVAWVLGLCSALFVFKLGNGVISYRYLWPTLLLLVALCFSRSSTLFYFCCCCALLLIWETSLGKRSILAFFLLAAMSPIARHMSYVWSFPIRLKLSDLAAQSLSYIGFPVQAQGNTIIFDGQAFAVDPACMGLQLLITTLILGVFIMAVVAYRYRLKDAVLRYSAGFVLLIMLAIGANFIRLLTLIVFHVLPENPLHDIVGLVSLLVYVLLPFYGFWIWWNKPDTTDAQMPITNKFAEENSPDKGKRLSVPLSNYLKFKPLRLPVWVPYSIQIMIVIAVISVSLQFRQTAVAPPLIIDTSNLSCYEQEWTDDGVLKLSNPSVLIYLKPPVKAYQGSHDPRICWQGSGYAFTHVDTLKLGKHTIYHANLEKDTDRLYTAWWYDSGPHKTIDEWSWRWATFYKKRQYRLVNITANDQASLLAEVGLWLE